MSSARIVPLLRQRLFTTSTRARHVISIKDVAGTQLTARVNSIPKLGRIAKWYLPTVAGIALGIIYVPEQLLSFDLLRPGRHPITLGDANCHIGFGITNALNEANRRVHVAPELSQQQKNMLLMDSYGERSSLEDMERAIAGLDSRALSQQDKNKVLEEAYGDRRSIKDVRKAMQIYEVQ